jgi:hypothetical protein
MKTHEGILTWCPTSIIPAGLVYIVRPYLKNKTKEQQQQQKSHINTGKLTWDFLNPF